MPLGVWQEWQTFMEVEPFGGMRSELHHASLMALLANVYRDRKKRSKPYATNDFLPAGMVTQPAVMRGAALRQEMLLWAMTHNERLKQQ